jgi:hypothetical protein
MEVRGHLMARLVSYQQLLDRLALIVAGTRSLFDRAASVELDTFCARGVGHIHGLGDATRRALERMRRVKMREYTVRDFYGNLIHSYTVPLDPQLPDPAEMVAHMEAVCDWWQEFARWLAVHGIMVQTTLDLDDLPPDGIH